MRKTIYVPSEDIWDRIKLIAEQGGMSVSRLILAQFEGGKVTGEPCEDWSLSLSIRLDRLGAKLDAVLGGGVFESASGRSDAEILAEGQAKLDEARRGRDIKKEKISKGFFNPQPKGGSKGGH